jgi:hypothetical protein
MVTFRQRRCELVDAFVATYRREVADALELLLAGEDGDAESLPRGMLAVVLERLLGRMRRALADLLRAEKRHLDEVGNDAVPRRRRDRAAAETRRVLFDLRQLYRAAYGELRAQEAGFERRIANDPVALARQAGRVYGQLSQAAEASREGTVAPQYAGLGPSIEDLAKILEAPLSELRAALVEVDRERARVQGTKVAKDRALTSFDQTYRLIVRMLVSAFRLAGQEELAARLPTSVRRPPRPSARG